MTKSTRFASIRLLLFGWSSPIIDSQRSDRQAGKLAIRQWIQRNPSQVSLDEALGHALPRPLTPNTDAALSEKQ